ELNKAENRHVRHRMFAIVDRTNLTTFRTNITFNDPTTGQPKAVSPGDTVNIGAVGTTVLDPRTGRHWLLGDGTTLVLEADTDNEETVVVKANAGQLTVTVTRAHNATVPAANRGNPGPWSRYDPRQDTGVVPYLAVID